MPTKQYRVLNPRNLPPEVHVLCDAECQAGGAQWNDGDVITKPSGWSTPTMRDLVELGYLEEASEDGED